MLGSICRWLMVGTICGLVGLGSGCSRDPDLTESDLAALPSAATTLTEVGQRLGRVGKPADLTRLAARSSRVVAALTTAERKTLGKSTLRFRVDRPSVVTVAVVEGDEPPFWLGDQGYRTTNQTAHDADGSVWSLYDRSIPAGVVGLGVNALDRSSTEHYAVYVRSLNEANGPPAITAVGSDTVMVRPAGRTVSPFADVDRPLVDLPAELTPGLVVLTRQADRADGSLLPFGRAWKSRQPSSIRPDQVVASFGIEPKHDLAISWRTDPSINRSVARFLPAAKIDEDPKLAQMFEGVVEPIRSDGLLNDPTIHRHKVRVSGLAAGTRYSYAVGDGSEQGWSRWYQTATAPETLRDYSFLYLGDAQCELEKWGKLAHVAVQARPDAGFMLLAGDLVDRGNERANWDHLFLRAEGVFDTIPFMPAVGNHEYLDKGPMIYRQTFDLPRNGPAGIDPNLVYSFEYADAFVAVLDSNLAIYDPRAAANQGEWLDHALAQTKATWKFVTFHHPIYASHPSRDNPQLGAAWGPIFDHHHVDLVLTGHDHAYLRTVPMRGGQPVASSAEGTTYVVSVSGEKFYGQTPHDFTARGMTNIATYQTIEVEVASRRLHYRSFDRDGREVDALTIEKPPELDPRPPAKLAGTAPNRD